MSYKDIPYRAIDKLFDEYGESHKNAINKAIHWICVPAIMFSLFGLFMAIPFPVKETFYANWAVVFMAVATLYYIRLSPVMLIFMAIIAGSMVFGNFKLYEALSFENLNLLYISLGIFTAAWIGQFIGHKIEGKKPKFIKDLQFLLVGPAWLLHFIFKKVGIPY